jgi:hypothetical protein
MTEVRPEGRGKQIPDQATRHQDRKEGSQVSKLPQRLRADRVGVLTSNTGQQNCGSLKFHARLFRLLGIRIVRDGK